MRGSFHFSFCSNTHEHARTHQPAWPGYRMHVHSMAPFRGLCDGIRGLVLQGMATQQGTYTLGSEQFHVRRVLIFSFNILHYRCFKVESRFGVSGSGRGMSFIHS
jgi:hypothetical protein